MITHILAAELGHITRNQIRGALQVLRPAGDLRFLRRLAHVGAIQHIEAPRLLQVRHQNGARLIPQPILAILKDPVLEAGLVVELADRNGGLLTLVRRIVAGHLRAFHHAGTFSGTAGHGQQRGAENGRKECFLHGCRKGKK